MQAADLARNRWPDLLTHFGIDPMQLTGKHAPCPSCGGRDRFRFDDQEGRGTFFCSKCGSGDGFALHGLVKGWSFKESATEVERIAGMIKPGVTKRQFGDADKIEACRRIWHESKSVIAGDPVHSYLVRRTGVENVPACIRFHPALPYRHDDGSITRHPAMIAKVGTTVTLFDQTRTPTPKLTKLSATTATAFMPSKTRTIPMRIKANLLETCQQCHPDATANFPDSWTSHFKPSLQNNPLVFLVNLFYQIVIPATLGFFSFMVATDVYRRVRLRLRG